MESPRPFLGCCLPPHLPPLSLWKEVGEPLSPPPTSQKSFTQLFSPFPALNIHPLSSSVGGRWGALGGLTPVLCRVQCGRHKLNTLQPSVSLLLCQRKFGGLAESCPGWDRISPQWNGGCRDLEASVCVVFLGEEVLWGSCLGVRLGEAEAWGRASWRAARRWP